MKKMKKLTSIILALVMVLSLATTAFAATVTVTDNSGLTDHTYKAYQIFTGTQENDVGALGDVAWGDGIDETNFVADLVASGITVEGTAIFKNCTADDPAGVAEAIAKLTTDSAELKKVAKIAYANKAGEGTELTTGENNLENGYYLIVDVTNIADDADDVYNAALLQVTNDITIGDKNDKPTSEKKVKDINDSTETTESNWQDSADHDIGDAVNFQLKATLPSDLAEYNKYYLAFHDTQSAGLTFNANSVKVYVDGTLVTDTTKYSVVTTDLTDDCTFEVVFADVKTVAGVKAGSVITVEYTSTLNENAVLGATGNPNEMHIEYSNDSNQVWDGEGKPSTGETPDDKVIVFTYKTIVNKVDENTQPLTGATFTMYKKLAVQPTTGTEGTDYIAETAADGTVTYWDVVGTVDGTSLSTFEWKGLDDGEYKLVETVTPAGYNTIDPVYFTIAATHELEKDDPQLLTLTGGDKFTGDVNAGTLTGTIINESGATLPETGGMGTTLFYVIGGLLAVAAVVLLVTKKRMHDAA